ncbi:MAG: hypothetical protein HC906_15320 [Bacteroidales bacterium]|nr:hypothetical protein [Bacteroidales bacterium]
MLHVQLLVGLILFFISPKVVFSTATMKNDMFRFFTVEHTLLMIIAVTLATIGYSRSKKPIDPDKKFKGMFWYLFIAFIITIIAIPWPWRELGTGWM